MGLKVIEALFKLFNEFKNKWSSPQNKWSKWTFI